jgi:hypothetical protein
MRWHASCSTNKGITFLRSLIMLNNYNADPGKENEEVPAQPETMPGINPGVPEEVPAPIFPQENPAKAPHEFDEIPSREPLREIPLPIPHEAPVIEPRA